MIPTVGLVTICPYASSLLFYLIPCYPIQTDIVEDVTELAKIKIGLGIFLIYQPRDSRCFLRAIKLV